MVENDCQTQPETQMIKFKMGPKQTFIKFK